MFFNLAVNGSVYSPNYEDITVEKIALNATLLDNGGNKLDNARAYGELNGFTFRHMANTSFNIPITMTYNVTSANQLVSDPALQMFEAACISTKSFKPQLTMSYTATISLGILAFTGYKPT
ncbi:hypothetical protein HK101_004686, partial [Irineochytrium annulatum]